MLQVQRSVGVVVLAVFASSVQAQPAATRVVRSSTSRGQKGGKYPIALPTAPESDAVAQGDRAGRERSI